MKTIDHENDIRTQGEILTSHIAEFGKAQISAFIGGLLDYLIMIICVEYFQIHLILAIGIGGVFGAVINFLINRYWTFKSNDIPILPQLIKFIIMALGSITLKAFGTYLFTRLLGINYKLTRIIVDAFVCFGFNFMVQKFWVFKKNR